MKKFFLSVLVLISSFSVFADNSGGYFALGGGALTFDDSVDKVKPKQLVARLGYDFNEYIGLGFEGSFSLITDELYGVDFDVTTTFLYLRAGAPLGDSAKVYAMFGTTNVELTGTVDDYSVVGDENGTGIGFGLEFNLGDGAFFIDQITYYDKDGVDVSSFNFGYSAYF